MRNSKKILVTGAAGFIGSHIVNSLHSLGYTNVFSVDDLSGGFLENIRDTHYFTKLDLRDKKRTLHYIEKIKPEIIFHLAADATEGRSQFTPQSCIERNLNGYLNVLIPAINTGVKKIVLTSSMSVYGSQKPPFDETIRRIPDDVYGISKSAMEHATEILSNVHGFSYVIIRPHNVYGPNQNLSDPYRNVVAIFINCLLNNKHFFIYGDGKQKRAFTYIDDVVPFFIKAAFLNAAENQIFNVGPTQEYTINYLAKIVLKNFFADGKISDRLKPQYLSSRPLEVKNAWCTVGKAQKILGYKTTVNIEEGVRKMIVWAKTKGPQKFTYLDSLEIVSAKTPKLWVKKLI